VLPPGIYERNGTRKLSCIIVSTLLWVYHAIITKYCNTKEGDNKRN